MHHNRKYIIFNVSEFNKIDFNQILETSIDTLRTSADGTKTFVKWDDDNPDFISELLTKEGPYTYTEMLDILNGIEWYKTVELI